MNRSRLEQARADAPTGRPPQSGLQDEYDSESSREVGGPIDPQHKISKSPDEVRLAGDDHSALQPSPTEALLSETSEEVLSWTKRMLNITGFNTSSDKQQ